MIKRIVNRLSFIIYKFSGRILVYYQKKGLRVGSNCRIYTSNFGSEPFLISIGNNVTITAGVTFVTHDGSAWLMRDNNGRRYVYSPIAIGNNVFVGVNSIIMPGVKIEDNVIVAAGSVVTKSVPTGSIVAGVPAKIIGSYEDIKSKMLETYISDVDLAKINGDYVEKIKQIASYSIKPYLKVS